MPEAWGQIVVRFDSSLDDALASSSDALSWEDAMEICRRAGVSPRDHTAFSVQVDEDSEFHFEGEPTRIADGYWLVSSFGDEWMYLLQALMASRSRLEIYGRIQHEHGFIEYYALGGGQHYFGNIDAECSTCSEDSEDAVIEKWLAATPAYVKEKLPDLFATEDEITDASMEESVSSEPWQPIAHEDFVRVSEGGNALLINESLLYDHEGYCFDRLRRAKQLGAVLIDPHPTGSAKIPFCTLHYVIDNLEIEAQRKTQIVSDMLTLFEFDIDAICRGYGDRWGTALFLAAGEGLTKVVDLLIARGGDPTRTEGNYAQESPLEYVKVSIAANEFEEPMEEEGEYLDFQAVLVRLETLVGTNTKQPCILAVDAVSELNSRPYDGKIRCPKCNWAANGEPDWQCSCGHQWDTFQTRAKCPACEKQWKDTDCPKCFASSRHATWYREA